MAYREKGKVGISDKQHANGNGHSKNDAKRDRFKLKELAEGIREIAMNAEHIDAAALR